MPWQETDGPLISLFGDALRQAGYCESALRRLIGRSTSAGGDPRAVEVAGRRLENGGELSTLIKLFCLGLSLPGAEVADALGQATAELLTRISVVAIEGASLMPLIAVDAADDLLIAHDLVKADGVLSADHVIGLGPAPRTLAALTVRRIAGRVLDLGTGSGIHALLALRHCASVIATDINPRALAYTRFNAALNRLPMPDIRQGSLFQPVADEAFDLIVANPPYVLSPDCSLQFRDSGLKGDELSRSVVRDAAEHLREGGFASILVSWVHGPDEGWSEPLTRFVQGLGCDAFLLHFRSYDPVTYASLWIRDEPRFGQTLERWLAYYRRLGIRSMSSGTVILRRRSGVNWTRSAQVSAAPVRQASEHLLRIFEAGDRLHRAADSELLDHRFRPHPGHRIHRTGVSAEGTYLVDGQYLETSAGIPIRVSLGQPGSRLLLQLDGSRSLRTALATVRENATGISSDEVMRRGLALVKELFSLGFLETDGPPLDRVRLADAESDHEVGVVLTK